MLPGALSSVCFSRCWPAVIWGIGRCERVSDGVYGGQCIACFCVALQSDGATLGCHWQKCDFGADGHHVCPFIGRADADPARGRRAGHLVHVCAALLASACRRDYLYAFFPVLVDSVLLVFADIMTTKVRSIELSTPLDVARKILRDNHIKALPVIDGHQALVGIITQSDFVAAIERSLRK